MIITNWCHSSCWTPPVSMDGGLLKEDFSTLLKRGFITYSQLSAADNENVQRLADDLAEIERHAFLLFDRYSSPSSSSLIQFVIMTQRIWR